MVTPHANAATVTPRRPTRDRVTHTLAALATVMGLWFGLTAPSISPVSAPPSPTAPAAAAQTASAAKTTGGQATPPQQPGPEDFGVGDRR